MFLTEVQKEAAWMTVGREMKNCPSQRVLPVTQLMAFQKQSQLMEIYQKRSVCDTPFKIYLMLPRVHHNVRSNENTVYKMFKT